MCVLFQPWFEQVEPVPNKALAGCVGFESSVFEEGGYSVEASIQIGQDGIVLGGLVPVHAGQHHQWDHAVQQQVSR